MGNQRVMRLVCVSLMVAWLAACGDDDDASTPDGGGSAGSGGRSGSTMDSGAINMGLPDDTAGKPCTSNAQCGGGICAMQIAGTGIGAMILPAPGGYCTANCMATPDCGAGGVCLDDLADLDFAPTQCYASCSSNDDCREGYICGGVMIGGVSAGVANSCRPAPANDQLEDDVAGDACSTNDDCAGGKCLTMRPGIGGIGGLPLPEGYCSGDCLENAHCGDGGVCVPPLLGAGAGSCYQGCADDGDCPRDGYRCRDVSNGVRACNPAVDPLPDNTAGDACSEDADCGGAARSCATQLPGAGLPGLIMPVPAPGGYCSQTCVENSDCGAGGVCLGALPFIGGGNCFQTCAGMNECRDGYTCAARGVMMMMSPADGGGASGPTVCSPVPAPADNDAG